MKTHEQPPELSFDAWTKKLPSGPRSFMKRLLGQARAAASQDLTIRIDAHLESIRKAQRRNEFINVEQAEELAATARKLALAVASLPPSNRIIASAAVLYFVTSDDAEGDLSSAIGFDDDAVVLASAFDLLRDMTARNDPNDNGGAH